MLFTFFLTWCLEPVMLRNYLNTKLLKNFKVVSGKTKVGLSSYAISPYLFIRVLTVD